MRDDGQVGYERSVLDALPGEIVHDVLLGGGGAVAVCGGVAVLRVPDGGVAWPSRTVLPALCTGCEWLSGAGRARAAARLALRPLHPTALLACRRRGVPDLVLRRVHEFAAAASHLRIEIAEHDDGASAPPVALTEFAAAAAPCLCLPPSSSAPCARMPLCACAREGRAGVCPAPPLRPRGLPAAASLPGAPAMLGASSAGAVTLRSTQRSLRYDAALGQAGAHGVCTEADADDADDALGSTTTTLDTAASSCPCEQDPLLVSDKAGCGPPRAPVPSAPTLHEAMVRGLCGQVVWSLELLGASAQHGTLAAVRLHVADTRLRGWPRRRVTFTAEGLSVKLAAWARLLTATTKAVRNYQPRPASPLPPLQGAWTVLRANTGPPGTSCFLLLCPCDSTPFFHTFALYCARHHVLPMDLVAAVFEFSKGGHGARRVPPPPPSRPKHPRRRSDVCLGVEVNAAGVLYATHGSEDGADVREYERMKAQRRRGHAMYFGRPRSATPLYIGHTVLAVEVARPFFCRGAYADDRTAKSVRIVLGKGLRRSHAIVLTSATPITVAAKKWFGLPHTLRPYGTVIPPRGLGGLLPARVARVNLGPPHASLFLLCTGAAAGDAFGLEINASAALDVRVE
eukprot:TRINITY_DN30095_c0_g1_i1.p1 TRINITY_DN30095_c0_g1~~TRINITY_DN30095_c0_g1_i1.p1  ORF type:complete len:627 (+),score=125.43 TRINITY_DN30095_c0_g1_i1:36-1916(+)